LLLLVRRVTFPLLLQVYDISIIIPSSSFIFTSSYHFTIYLLMMFHHMIYHFIISSFDISIIILSSLIFTVFILLCLAFTCASSLLCTGLSALHLHPLLPCHLQCLLTCSCLCKLPVTYRGFCLVLVCASSQPLQGFLPCCCTCFVPVMYIFICSCIPIQPAYTHAVKHLFAAAIPAALWPLLDFIPLNCWFMLVALLLLSSDAALI
jgi:hypothetical protein